VLLTCYMLLTQLVNTDCMARGGNDTAVSLSVARHMQLAQTDRLEPHIAAETRDGGTRPNVTRPFLPVGSTRRTSLNDLTTSGRKYYDLHTRSHGETEITSRYSYITDSPYMCSAIDAAKVTDSDSKRQTRQSQIADFDYSSPFVCLYYTACWRYYQFKRYRLRHKYPLFTELAKYSQICHILEIRTLN